MLKRPTIFFLNGTMANIRPWLPVLQVLRDVIFYSERLSASHPTPELDD